MSTARNTPENEPRDPRIAEAYREAVAATSESAEPPSALDNAIRAAARRAVHAQPETIATQEKNVKAARDLWQRWQTPFAAVATVLLAIGVAVKVYDSGEADVRSTQSTQAPSPSAPAALPAEAPERKRAASAPAAPESARAEEPSAPILEKSTERFATPAAAPAAAPSAMAAGRESGAVESPQQGQLRRDEPPPIALSNAPADARDSAGGSAAASTGRLRESAGVGSARITEVPAAPPALAVRPERRAVMEDRMAPGSSVSSLIAQLANRPAEAWFDEIRALKRAGRIADANTLITEFRRRFPASVLPDDLR
jgi:hypothetical protein